MSFFEETYRKLFGNKNQKSSAVSVTTVLKRSATYSENYKQWTTSEDCAKMIGAIDDSYYWSQKGVGKKPAISLLQSNHSNGFAISFDPMFEEKNFKFIIDYFSDRVKELDYRLVVSRETLQEKKEEVHKTEMLYLKPKMGFVAPIDQKFGNIQIEYIEVDDQPKRIKLLVNSYPDRQYSEPKSFEDLVNYIFNQNSKSQN